MAEGKPYHDGDLAKKLLEHGRAALATTPADQLSLREIAKSLGRAPSATVTHFKTKDVFLAALARDGYRELTSMTRAAIATETPEERREALVDGYIRFARANPHLYALMFSAPLPERAPELEDAASESYRLLTEALALDGIREDAVVLVWASLHGLVALAASGRLLEAGDLDVRLQHLGQTIYATLLAKSAFGRAKK